MIKTCSKCSIEKNIEFFPINKGGLYGRKSVCKECEKVKHTKWYEENKDKKQAQNKQWKQENKSSYSKQQKQYREENKTKLSELLAIWYQNNRELVLAKSKAYYQNNPSISITKFARRRERERHLNSKRLTPYFVFSIKEKFENKCFICGTNEQLCIDHHIPILLGGVMEEKNAVLLCKSCNSKKGAKHPSRFYSEEQIHILQHILKQEAIDAQNQNNNETN
jgi:5-methylcytosine-specific restriction endonuclease McrA